MVDVLRPCAANAMISTGKVRTLPPIQRSLTQSEMLTLISRSIHAFSIRPHGGKKWTQRTLSQSNRHLKGK